MVCVVWILRSRFYSKYDHFLQFRLPHMLKNYFYKQIYNRLDMLYKIKKFFFLIYIILTFPEPYLQKI